MSNLITVHFPDGRIEYSLSEAVPETGDVVSRNGEQWTVAEATDGNDGTISVTLRSHVTAGEDRYDLTVG
jgi:hypothetical protein